MQLDWSLDNKCNIQEHLDIDRLYKPELLALKLARLMENESVHLTSEGEGYWFRSNGLYDLLDTVTSFCNYPKNKITIDTWNLLESHSEYNINKVNEIFCCYHFENPVFKMPKEYKTGIFIGRANYNRLLFHHLRGMIVNPENLIYTFHQSLIDNPWPVGLKKLIESTDANYSRIFNSLPHSDIGELIKPPITPPENIFGLKDVYDSIGLEIVFETVDQGFFLTEKTLRPMFFGRPFIVVGPKNVEVNLEKLGFKWNFNFDFTIEAAHEADKVYAAVSVINTWYEKINKEEWFASIIPILHHNQRVLHKYADINGKIDKSIVDSLI